MIADERAKLYIKDKFLESRGYNPDRHGSPEDITVLSADTDWECGCYSEYTRNDYIVSTATIQTKTCVVEWEYQLDNWNLPEAFKAMADYHNPCQYEEED